MGGGPAGGGRAELGGLEIRKKYEPGPGPGPRARPGHLAGLEVWIRIFFVFSLGKIQKNTKKIRKKYEKIQKN